MPPVQRLGHHAAHGITHGGEPVDTKDPGQRGEIISAILHPEPRTQADPIAMATQVGRDDPEMTRERRENHPPVQLGRARDPVDQDDRLRAAWTGALPHPRCPAAG